MCEISIKNLRLKKRKAEYGVRYTPKRCHALVIKKFLEMVLNKEGI